MTDTYRFLTDARYDVVKQEIVQSLGAVTLTAVDGAPTTHSIWLDSTTGHVFRGPVDLEDTGGDVFGPASSTLNAVPRYADGTGKVLLASGVLINGSNLVSGVIGETLVPQGANPGGVATLWVNSGNGHLFRGAVDCESVSAGDVVGPASATDNALARYDTTTGKLLQNSIVTASDIGVVSGVIAETFTAQGANPGGATTVWVNSGNGHLFRGAVDVETVGSGDVVGPGSATDNALARFDLTTGKLLQNGIVTESDTGLLSGVIGETFTVQGVNPGGAATVWVDSGTGHLMRGAVDVEVVGSGDVVGPVSSTDNAIARWDGASGQIIQDSVLKIDDINGFISDASDTLIRFHSVNGSVAIGRSAGPASFFLGCTSLGYHACQNTAANLNTGVGYLSLEANTTGSANTAFGAHTGEDITVGNSNCLMGNAAGFKITTGSGNTLIGGDDAGVNITTGSNNVMLLPGNVVSGGVTTGDNNCYISGVGTVNESDTIRIGQSSHTRNFTHGIRGITTGVANAIPVLVDGAGQLGTLSSSVTVKENIVDMDGYSTAILSLQPRMFSYIADETHTLYPGLIGEEVDEIMPELVIRDYPEGPVVTVDYSRLGILNLNEIQKIVAAMATMQATITSMASDITTLQTQVASLLP